MLCELDRFEELVESCGNRYLAIRWVSMWSRQLSREYEDYCIMESKLLQWVITGHCPYLTSDLEARRIVRDDDKLSRVLEWVTDEEVVNEVKQLYANSIKQHRLLSCNNKSLSRSKADRSNILLRMAWYSCSEKGIENHG